MTWNLEVRGGAFDGWCAETIRDPAVILIMWRCSPFCDGHGTFDPQNPNVILATAECYRRVEIDVLRRLAVYETVEEDLSDPHDATRELAGVGGETR